jgi:hypothetical protein
LVQVDEKPPTRNKEIAKSGFAVKLTTWRVFAHWHSWTLRRLPVVIPSTRTERVLNERNGLLTDIRECRHGIPESAAYGLFQSME